MWGAELLWTQLRHVSHMDCKTRIKIVRRERRCGGVQWRFDGLGGQRLIHHMSRIAYNS
jgi:hypothetical protein